MDDHGIHYTPDQIRSANPSTLGKPVTIEWAKENALAKDIGPCLSQQTCKPLTRHPGYVYVYWVDLTNTRRCRVLPIAYFLSLLEQSKRPGVNIARANLGLVYLNMADGFTGTGELLYKFDLSTMNILYGVGELGRAFAIMGCFEHKDPVGHPSPSVDICPRSALINAVK
jgi:hypothetical protein